MLSADEWALINLLGSNLNKEAKDRVTNDNENVSKVAADRIIMPVMNLSTRGNMTEYTRENKDNIRRVLRLAIGIRHVQTAREILRARK